MTDKPASLDLDEIAARANAATPGPWKIENDYCDCSEYGCSHPPFAVAFGPFTSFENTTDRHHFDAEFAAHARTDVPTLLDEVRRLRARIAELERPAVEAKRNEIRQSYADLVAAAEETKDFEGAFDVQCRLREREEQWAREDAATPAP